MHANVHTDRNKWRLPPDETLQVGDPKTKKAEELAYHGDEGHNWWSIIFSLLVIGLVITGIITAIYLLGYVDELLYWHGKRMQINDFMQGDLNPSRLPPSWISSTQFVFQNDDGGLAVLNTKDFKVSLLVTNHTLRQLNVRGYQCSKDLKYVLFQHNVKSVEKLNHVLQAAKTRRASLLTNFQEVQNDQNSPVFRQSFTALYTIYDVSKDHHIPVRLASSPKAQPQRLQHCTWLGNTNALLIIFDNDIYYRTTPSDETDTRLTFTGQPNVVYNGIPDWLYQEEKMLNSYSLMKNKDVLTHPQALWGSHDGTHLMYATFNDTNVNTLVFPWFSTGTVLAAAGVTQRASSFPELKSIRYPTPGSANPTVNLWVLDLTNLTDLQRYEVHPPSALKDQEYYLTSAGWIGKKNSQVSAVWMNRAQNLSIISACLAPNWTCVEIHTERAKDDAWLDIQEHPIFSPDGDSFLLLASVVEGSVETYTHIKHVTQTQQHIAVVSHGRYEVQTILAWDTVKHSIYYLATREHTSQQDYRPGQRHLYVAQDPASPLDSRTTEPQCITCDLSDYLWSSRYYYDDVNCTHFNALISPHYEDEVDSGMKYYVLQCEGPGLPLASIHSTKTNKLLNILYDTRPKQGPILRQFALPQLRSFEVPLAQGSRAQVQLLLPPSWRKELRHAAYPVLVEVNGRPGSKAVTDEFKIDWGTYMSSHCDVVYVKLDVRGARGQSNRALYHHLGGVEVQDQIAVIRHLLETETFLDETRVAIWGWGYGGYVTAMVLGSQPKVFKCGIAVSPISDWLYYNSAFTERVLGLPAENYKGYVEADATQRAKNIPSKSLFILHGLADLSAPYQHGIALARALTDAGILFKYQSYADEGHELHGALRHVYTSMEDYFQECLSLDTDDPRNPGNT